MTRRLRLIAPAKINWSLEVLRIRPDGYHELRSVLQTIDLCDVVTLSEARDIALRIGGEAAGMLADNAPETNLAYRAAIALRERTGARRGVLIELEKHVPVAAGLGGGSSDAAAVLRGLDVLWDLRQPRMNLIELAGELGSDPPFFVVGGTATVRGRGDHVEPLPDVVAPAIMLATPPPHGRKEKTAAMFAALTPDDFAEGYVTIGLREIVETGRRVADADLNNVFERVAARLQPQTGLALEALRAQGLQPHLAGAGPSFFVLLEAGIDRDGLAARIGDLGFTPRVVQPFPRAEALRVEEI